MFRAGLSGIFSRSSPMRARTFFTMNKSSAVKNSGSFPVRAGLKLSAVWPSLRNFATHREIYSRLSSRQRYQSGWGKWTAPLLFAAGVVAFDYFALPYVMKLPFLTPIRRSPELAVYAIIAVNGAAFLAWRMPGLPQQFMLRYGLLQKMPPFFKPGQMLGMAFSHQNFWHFAINMFVLYQFGVPIARWMGATNFLECYLDSCVISSLGSMIAPALLGRFVPLPSLGASGAVFACVGAFSYLMPNAGIALWFIPLPIGAWSVFLLTLGYNAFAMVSTRYAAFSGAGIDYAGHVFGSLVGIVYGYLTQKRIDERRRRLRSMGFW